MSYSNIYEPIYLHAWTPSLENQFSILVKTLDRNLESVSPRLIWGSKPIEYLWARHFLSILGGRQWQTLTEISSRKLQGSVQAVSKIQTQLNGRKKTPNYLANWPSSHQEPTLTSRQKKKRHCIPTGLTTTYIALLK